MNDNADNDPRLYAIPDIHGHAKGEHKAFIDERPIPLSARMLFLWFYHACRRGWPRFLMVTDHMNYLTFEDPAAINLVRRALKLAQAGDLYGAAETASVEVGHAAVVSEGLRRGMRYSIGAEVDNDPRSRPDAQNIVDAMKPDGMIRSVHFLTIDHPTHGPNWNWPFDNPEFSDVFELIGAAKTWELYMATLLDAVERLPGNILGHFYVPALFGHWPDDATLERYEDQIVEACEARGMAIELNTRFLYRDHSEEERQKFLTAHRRLLAKCKAKNVGIAVGSDAHSPKDQGRAFGIILPLLDACEINELVFPIAGRLARVALRVERKPEPTPAAEPASAPVADDRKAVRKPRTSEAPARPKDSSSKRDDAVGNEDDGVADEAAPAKGKPRPKRSRNRTAAPGDDGQDAAPNDAGAPSDASTLAEDPEAATDVHVNGAISSAGDESANDITFADPTVGESPVIVEAATEIVSAALVEPIVEAPADVGDAVDAVDAVEREPGGDAIADDDDDDADTSDDATIAEFAGAIAAELAESTAGHVDGPATLDETAAIPRGDAAVVVRKAPRPKAAAGKAKPSTTAARSKPAPAKTKPAAKKAAKPAPKVPLKKAPAKKTAAKKAPPKKAVAKKVAAKKSPAKKAAVRSSGAKKAGAKKSSAKKPAGKKPAPKRR